MIQNWRRKLKQAALAYKIGRLDEAGRLLREDELREYLPGKRLSVKVAARMAQRAGRRAAAGDTSAGWRDLEEARLLGGETDHVLAIRGTLVAEALDEAEKYLQAGDAAKAVARLERLQRRDVQNKRLRTLREVARRVEAAERYVRHGKFAEAEMEVAAAAELAPRWRMLSDRKKSYRAKARASRRLTEKLHAAMSARRFTQVVRIADRLLALAPESRVAREARAVAWKQVGARVSNAGQLMETQVFSDPQAPPRSGNGAARGNVPAGGKTLTQQRPAVRHVLWIDAVGGYLVCHGDETSIGQAIPGNPVDVPIVADLRGRHAVIRREDEQYLIEPISDVRLEGKRIQSPALLSDGDEIQLGDRVRLRFRRPHPLSASARLEFVSRHRCSAAPDGVLLMAESCVLGPREANHVVCRDWSDDVVLFRQGGELHCRAGGPFEVSGRWCDGRGVLRPGSHVAGEDFSLSLEEV